MVDEERSDAAHRASQTKRVYIPLKPEADGEGGVHLLRMLLSIGRITYKVEAVGQMPHCFKPHPNPPHSGFLHSKRREHDHSVVRSGFFDASGCFRLFLRDQQFKYSNGI